MIYDEKRHQEFLSVRAFFCKILQEALKQTFGLKNLLFLYFDLDGHFLSWDGPQGLVLDGEGHPYRSFMSKDVIRQRVYEDAVRDRLMGFDPEPRLYRSSDVIGAADYENSEYARFLKQNFGACYSVVMGFGIHAYIQLTILREQEFGDFTEAEMKEMERIYVYVANFCQDFKEHEKKKIVSHMQNEIAESGEHAYLVADDFMYVMSYNEKAKEYLRKIVGNAVAEQMERGENCLWLAFLLGGPDADIPDDRVRTHVFNDFIFKIYTYDQNYPNGIVDRYHWITISGKEEESEKRQFNFEGAMPPLTQTEKRVALLMYQGLTYKAMAKELVVSYHTVKNHVQNIYTKCGVKSRFQLCEWLGDLERK